MHHFDSDGVSIAYYLEGPEEGPPVVLVHGFCSSFQVNWRGSRWVDTLARAGRRVVGLDNRGHGHSGKPHDPAAYGPRMVADVVNLLDHLGIERAAYIGYSMGSNIGLRVLLQHPERVSRAVLGGIGMNVTRRWDAASAVAARLRGDESQDGPAPTLFHTFATSVHGNDLEALACCITAPSEPIGEEQLASIQTPVLVAVGGADPVARDGRRLAGLLPHGEYFEVPGRDHATAVPSRAIKDRALEFLEEVAPD